MDRSPTPVPSFAKLRGCIDHVDSLLKTSLQFPDANIDAARAAFGLLRAMTEQAEAIALLATTHVVHAAGANLRSLFEAWIQLRYIVQDKDPNREARRCIIFALTELRDRTDPDVVQGEDRTAIERQLDSYCQADPQVAAEVARARERKGSEGRYWTRMGPSALAGFVEQRMPSRLKGKDVLQEYYKYASWDAHHVLTPVLRVHVDTAATEPAIRISESEYAPEEAEYLCSLAGRMLQDASNDVVRTLSVRFAQESGNADTAPATSPEAR